MLAGLTKPKSSVRDNKCHDSSYQLPLLRQLSASGSVCAHGGEKEDISRVMRLIFAQNDSYECRRLQLSGDEDKESENDNRKMLHCCK